MNSMDVYEIAAMLPFNEGKSKRLTIEFFLIVLAHDDIAEELAGAVRSRKTDLEVVAVMQKLFFSFNSNLRKKLPRAKSQAEWRGMFARGMSRVDWEWMVRFAQVVYQSEGVA